MAARLQQARSIGPWGTAARAVVGAAMLVGAAVIGIGALDLLLGLVVFPVAVIAVLALRGREAPALRFMGPGGYCLVYAVGIAAFVFVPVAALLFYGTSMLVAATRGYGGCELLAVSNWVRRRDDQIACCVFTPIDVAEGRGRKVAQ